MGLKLKLDKTQLASSPLAWRLAVICLTVHLIPSVMMPLVWNAALSWSWKPPRWLFHHLSFLFSWYRGVSSVPSCYRRQICFSCFYFAHVLFFDSLKKDVTVSQDVTDVLCFVIVGLMCVRFTSQDTHRGNITRSASLDFSVCIFMCVIHIHHVLADWWAFAVSSPPTSVL